jgi:hypothetical protein
LRLTIFSEVASLPTPSPPAGASNDRENVNRARQAAEDLFRPRREAISENIGAGADNAAVSAELQTRRPPRVFMIPAAGPMRAGKADTAAEPKPARRPAATRDEPRVIPASEFGRVRALARYGMTRTQVAKLYGVSVGEVERVIRQPNRSRRS